MPLSYNYYWPNAEGEPIIQFEYVMCLGQALSLIDGNSYFFGYMERYIDTVNNTASMIFYFCSNTPHTHPDLPSCSRYVMCFPLDNRDIPTL